MTSQPSISVVVVSDYEAGHTKTWENERRILAALAQQDIAEHFEILLILNSEFRGAFLESGLEAIPDLQTIFVDESQSAKLKDYGVQKTASEYIAVLEADCIPCREWLRVLVDVLRSRKDISVVSGRTTYGQETMFKRSLSLTDRGFDDPGNSGLTLHVSNNGALYRRSVLKKFPFPDAITPFLSSRLRNHSMRKAGHRFYFERRAVMKHALGGWEFVRDLRRNRGYADMMYHGDTRFFAVPKLLLSRLNREVSNFKRLRARYLRLYDWPLTMLLMIFGRFLEAPGMLDAVYRRNEIRRSSYR